MIPSFLNEDGKFIYGRGTYEALLKHYYNKDKEFIVDGVMLEFGEELKKDDVWHIKVTKKGN